MSLFLPGTQVVDPGGISTTRLAVTDDPRDTADDDEITLVAVDRGAACLLTNFGLLRVATWSGHESEVGPLEAPWDVAIDRDGLVGVTDPGRRRVVVLRHDGKSLEALAAFDGFLDPTGIAADGNGGFWVCDRRFNTVFHLDTTTGNRSTLGLEVAFDRPVDVAAVGAGERLAQGHTSRVVVVDRGGQRIRSFGPAGELRATHEAAGSGVPDAIWDAIEIDYYGNVFAVDRRSHRIHKFREDLYPLDVFGERGVREGEFLEPRGIAIHRKLGQVFVTESGGGQYLWVGTDIKAFGARDRGTTAEFRFGVTEESTIDLRILDSRGRPVADVFEGRRVSAGRVEAVWDGRDSSGQAAPRGDYLAEIRGRATYASRSTFECEALRPFTLGIEEGTP